MRPKFEKLGASGYLSKILILSPDHAVLQTYLYSTVEYPTMQETLDHTVLQICLYFTDQHIMEARPHIFFNLCMV